MAATLPDLLRRTAEQGGSDLHLTAGTPPRIRVHGELRPQDDLDPLSAADTKRLIYSGLTDAQRRCFEETSELDCAFGAPGVTRVRANVFGQRGGVAAVYRLIPDRIPGLETLGLPPVVSALVERPHGLVLVTGTDRQRQEHHARGDGRPDQQPAAGAHPDDRGSDRVRPSAQALDRPTSARCTPTRPVSPRLSALRCAKTPTSC